MKHFVVFVLINIALASSVSIRSKKNATNGRIIGGRPAFEGQYPYAAAIRVSSPTGRYFCGGALISNQWILTSAQCVDGATLFEIELGSIHLQSNDPNTVTVQATESVTHPDYDASQFLNDIGLIKLTQPVTFTNYIKAVDFLPHSSLSPNTVARAIGWGQTSDSEGGPVNDLNWVELYAISNEECKLFYQDQLKDGMICVVGQNNEGSCIGDIGTPLVQIAFGIGHHVHVGIASFLSGNGCESTDPSGYTRTFEYKDWITNTTGL